MSSTLSSEELRKIDAYWRAARSATGSGRRFSSLGDLQCRCGGQPLFASMIAAQTKPGR